MNKILKKLLKKKPTPESDLSKARLAAHYAAGQKWARVVKQYYAEDERRSSPKSVEVPPWNPPISIVRPMDMPTHFSVFTTHGGLRHLKVTDNGPEWADAAQGTKFYRERDAINAANRMAIGLPPKCVGIEIHRSPLTILSEDFR